MFLWSFFFLLAYNISSECWFLELSNNPNLGVVSCKYFTPWEGPPYKKDRVAWLLFFRDWGRALFVSVRVFNLKKHMVPFRVLSWITQDDDLAINLTSRRKVIKTIAFIADKNYESVSCSVVLELYLLEVKKIRATQCRILVPYRSTFQNCW